jgi:hypothetical protein
MTSKQFFDTLEFHGYEFVKWDGMLTAIVAKDGKEFYARQDTDYHLEGCPQYIVIHEWPITQVVVQIIKEEDFFRQGMRRAGSSSTPSMKPHQGP